MTKKILALALCAVLVLLCACGTQQKTCDINAVFDTFQLSSEDVFEYTAEEALFYYGMDARDVKAIRAATSLDGISCDEVVLVEATGEEAAKNIRTALENRLNNKKLETENYLPDEYAVIAKCSVEQSGCYVSMIVCERHEELTKLYKESFQ